MNTLKFNMVLNSLHVKLECHFQQSRELSRQIYPSSNLVSKNQALTQPAAALSLSTSSPNLAQKALPLLNGFSSGEQADQRGRGLVGDKAKRQQAGMGALFPGSSILSPQHHFQWQVLFQKQVKGPPKGPIPKGNTVSEGK